MNQQTDSENQKSAPPWAVGQCFVVGEDGKLHEVPSGWIDAGWLEAKAEEYHVPQERTREDGERREMAWACRFVIEIWNNKRKEK